MADEGLQVDDDDWDDEDDGYEEEDDEHRTYAVMNPGASEDQIRELVEVLPIAPPEIWLNILRGADGFETCLRSPFWAMPTSMMISMALQPDRWTKKFITELPNVVPVAVAVDGGFFVLDLDTLTPTGDCMVVRMTAGTVGYEEHRKDSVGLWLADSLNEDDWDKFRPTLPQLPEQSIEYDLIDAARRGHIREVARLLDKGADVNATDRFGSALEQAADCEHDPVVELLKSRGAVEKG